MLSFVFACPHWCVFIQTHTFLMRFRVSSNLKLPKTLTLFSGPFSKDSTFHPTMCQNRVSSRDSTFDTILKVFISIFGYFSKDDGRKRIKKYMYVFSKENALVKLEASMIISIISIITIAIVVVFVIILSCHHTNSVLED